MNLRDYDEKDGKKVWLSDGEVEVFLGAADHTEQRIAFALGARCGLRSHEIVAASPQDLVESIGDGDDDAGAYLRVWHGKGDKYRETPVPPSLVTTIETIADVREEPADAPLVDVTTRTVRRWVAGAGEQLKDETDDPGWSFLGPHDLRRTWGTALINAGVDPMLVMDWGGWEDIETFKDAYFGVFNPQAMARERAKVAWL